MTILVQVNQQCARICTTPLLHIPASTDFGSSHIMCSYVACVPDCRGSVCCASQLNALRWDAQQTEPRQSSTQATFYDIPPILFEFQVTQEDLISSLMMA